MSVSLKWYWGICLMSCLYVLNQYVFPWCLLSFFSSTFSLPLLSCVRSSPLFSSPLLSFTLNLYFSTSPYLIFYFYFVPPILSSHFLFSSPFLLSLLLFWFPPPLLTITLLTPHHNLHCLRQVLWFKKMREHHSGSYTCEAANAAATANHTASIKVKVSQEVRQREAKVHEKL